MKFFVYDESMANTKAKITVSKLAAMSDIVASEKKYLTAGDSSAPNELTLDANVLIAVGNSVFKSAETALTVSNLDTGSGFAAGSDYYVYCCDPTSGAEATDTDEVYKISLNATYPDGYTADNSRKIGGFHYGTVRVTDDTGRAVGTDGSEYGTSWASNVYTGIVPASVWTLLHLPKCEDPSGMVYVGAGMWVDIYMASDDGANGCASVYNTAPMTGTECINWYLANERARRVGKRLPTYAEYCQYAYGSPEGTDSGNTNAWTATGNTGRHNTGLIANATSAVGCRDCVGNVWEWLDDSVLDPTASSWNWYDITDNKGFGDMYIPSSTAFHALVAGGSWSDGVHCGARALNAPDYPWNVHATLGFRCVCDSL